MRRVLRTHRNVTWISALSADPCHLAQHCLVRVVAEELEASKGCRVQFFASLVGQSLRLNTIKQFIYGMTSLVAQDGKLTTCNAGDLSLIPGLGRSLGGGNGNCPLQFLPRESHG